MSGPRPIRRVLTGDRLTDDAQRSAQESARRLNNCPLVNGRLLTEDPGEVVGSGLAFTVIVDEDNARSIAHGLGRKAIGFLEVQGADLPGERPNLATSAHPGGISSETHITVTPAATGRCFVWVF